MKRNVYFVQANPVYGETEKNVYIPYAVGCIAAYAWSDTTIQNNYRLGRFIYTREDIKTALASFNHPFLVGFSCSVWNMEYNKAFAWEIKKIYPDCIVLFGGHHVSPDSSNLAEYEYTDLLIHGGGEEAFKDVLLAFAGNQILDGIPNISYRAADGYLKTTKKTVPKTADYPSPYLEGYFDEILKDKIKFSAIIETNRGCANSCAFCDWGDLKAKIRLFPLEKIKRELTWLADNQFEYIYCGDANFGLFDRDEEIADLIIEQKTQRGYPQKFRVSFTKNRSRFVQKISKKLNDNNIDKFHTLSFQSLSPVVLENVGRKNLDLNHFKNLMFLFNQSGISAVSELIIGLPGETYESFCMGMCTLLECGQHNSITVYPCELLPNSQMAAPDFISRFGLKAVKSPYYQIHCETPESNSSIQEYSEFVISTNTLTQTDWVRAVIFSCFVQALHNLGLTRIIAIYLRFESSVSYLSFYSDLINVFMTTPHTMINRIYRDVEAMAQGVVDGRNAWVWESEKFGNITWGFEEIIFLELASNLPTFFKEIRPFLDQYRIEQDVYLPLLDYQRSIIKQPAGNRISLNMEYDFYTYFEKIYRGEYAPLVKIKSTLNIYDEKPVDNWDDYAREIVWFGRTEDATVYTSSKYDVTIEL